MKVKIRDISMHYELLGPENREPVIVLHNFLGTGRDMHPIANILAKEYLVYVLDWRGHGLTNNPKSYISHRELAEDTLAFTKEMALTKSHFVGFSSGGMHLFFLALKHPEIIQSMSLLSVTYVFNTYAQEVVKKVRNSVSPSVIKELEIKHCTGILGRQPQYALKLLDQWRDSVLREGELPFTPDMLQEIDIPALVLHGDRDIYFPVEIPIIIFQSLPNARLGIAPGGGHDLDSLSLFYPTIVSFIRQHALNTPTRK